MYQNSYRKSRLRELLWEKRRYGDIDQSAFERMIDPLNGVNWEVSDELSALIAGLSDKERLVLYEKYKHYHHPKELPPPPPPIPPRPVFHEEPRKNGFGALIKRAIAKAIKAIYC